MMRFLHTLRILLSTWTWTEDNEWKEGDAETLQGFLRSTRGSTFAARLRNRSIQFNAAAVQSGEVFKCGHAAGYMRCIADIEELSAYGEPESPKEDEDAVEGAEAYLERNAP